MLKKQYILSADTQISFASHFASGDIEAFFGMFADAFSKISVIIAVLLLGEKMPKELVLHRILPGIAAASITGCLLYFFHAHRLCVKENRSDVTALPFGISSTHVFTWLFIIIVPVYRQTGDAYFAWQIGLASCFFGGVIELCGVFLARPIRRYIPQAALLCNMAAASLLWLSFNSMAAVFEKTLTALFPLFISFLTFSWHKKIVPFIPNAVLILLAGAAAAWLTGGLQPAGVYEAANTAGMYPPSVFITDIFEGIRHIKPYISMIIPLQIANFLVTVQAVETAETAGDRFSLSESMLYDGITTLVSALCGSPFPTTVYYGHSGWKQGGARSGYLLLLIIPYVLMFFGLSMLFLAVIPFEVIIVFLLTVGITVAVKVQNNLAEDYSSVLYVSLFPITAQYILTRLDSVLHLFSVSISEYGIENFAGTGTLVCGLLYLSYGAFASSLLYSVWMVYVLKKNYRAAAVTAFVLAGLSAVGFIHQPVLAWLPAGSIQFVVPYVLTGCLCLWMSFNNKKIASV